MKKVIDFRVRPPSEKFKAFHRAYEPLLGIHAEFRGPKAGIGRNGYYHPESWYNSSLKDCVKEMEELGVVGVTPARVPRAGFGLPPVTHDDVWEMANKYPGRFVPLGSIDTDPDPIKRREAQEEIDRIAKLGFKGIEISVYSQLLPDDLQLSPIYEQCQDLGLVCCILRGPGAGPGISFASPLPLEQVAKAFPKLQIVIVHGAWPFIDDLIGVMMKRQNIWVSPGLKYFFPGGQLYIDAINWDGPFKSTLCNRFLYASATPYGPGVRANLERFLKLPLTDAAMEKVLYKNAAILLGLEV